eukprot:m.151372 g.151372  ORF g.151372 m.151372 type:complete len:529 (+) comp52822_c0_seq4:148-1734(+)
MKRVFAAVAVVAVLCLQTRALQNGLGEVPPMGWSSWNYFFTNVNDTLIREIALAMHQNNMLSFGYEYINIDAGYLLDTRDSSGNLVVNPVTFPYGMANLSDYVHSLGFKLGVYTDLGSGSCGSGPGSFGAYPKDAAAFANWGVDYLKVDFCGSVPEGNSEWYYWSLFRDALNATGRPIYYSICPKTIAPAYGTATPYAGSLIYSPPLNWTAQDHQNLSNSWLVEYVNNVDNWYSEDATNCTDAGLRGMIVRLLVSGWTVCLSVDACLWITRLLVCGCPSACLWMNRVLVSGRTVCLFVDGLSACLRMDRLLVCGWPVCCLWMACLLVSDGWRLCGAGAPCGFITNVDAVLQMTDLGFSGPGGWNDADMLQTCNYGHENGGMTLEEYRAEFSLLAAVFVAPLILSADMRSMPTLHPDCFEIVTNRQVIALNKDFTGQPAWVVSTEGNTTVSITTQVFARPISFGYVVMFFNRGLEATTMRITWHELGLPHEQSLLVTDVWTSETFGYFTSEFSDQVASHACLLLTLTLE